MDKSEHIHMIATHQVPVQGTGSSLDRERESIQGVRQCDNNKNTGANKLVWKGVRGDTYTITAALARGLFVDVGQCSESGQCTMMIM